MIGLLYACHRHLCAPNRLRISWCFPWCTSCV